MQHDDPQDLRADEAPAFPRRRPRWAPESADDARYAHLGHGDVDSARYDAAHRSPQPRE
jgi:hypothetical protein